MFKENYVKPFAKAKPALLPKPRVENILEESKTVSSINNTSNDNSNNNNNEVIINDTSKLLNTSKAEDRLLNRAFVDVRSSTLQQTKPPSDADAELRLTLVKSVISFDDEIIENSYMTCGSGQFYSTLPKSQEKKICLYNPAGDGGGGDEKVTAVQCLSVESARTQAKSYGSQEASQPVSVCWKSEEMLMAEPEEFSTKIKIEPSPERFLDDILRKRKSLRSSVTSPYAAKFKTPTEVKDANHDNDSGLLNLIPAPPMAEGEEDEDDDDDDDEDDNYDDDANDSDENSDDDDDDSLKRALKSKTSAKSTKNQTKVEYANLRDGKYPLGNSEGPFYANLQPMESNKLCTSPEEKEKVRKMNQFFGVTKDTATDIESKVFASLTSGNDLSTIRHKQQQQQQAKKPQAQKGRHRLGHLRGNAKESSPTSHASGQLLQDLARMKRWAVDNLPLLTKGKHRSTDQLATLVTPNQNLTVQLNQPSHLHPNHNQRNLGHHQPSFRSVDWSSWKQKFIKGVKRHLTGGLTSLEEEAESSVVVATFGVPLELCPMSSIKKHVPAIVEFCVTVVENLGLSSQGIYRVPGNNASVNELLSELNKDPDSITFENTRWQDVNVIGSLLKLFFRKLPDPLMTADMYDRVIKAARCENREKKLLGLKLTLRDLPATNHETFKYLANHLSRVAANQSVNKMGAHNLAIMFGPSLVRPKEELTNQLISDMNHQTEIVENIIKYCDWMFSPWTEESNVPPDERAEGGTSRSSYLNPQLLPSAEAILAIKTKELELEGQEGHGFFTRQGLRRSGNKGKVTTRGKGRKSNETGKSTSGPENEVKLKRVDLTRVSKSGTVWRSLGMQNSSLLNSGLKRNLTQKYASNELEISSPFGGSPASSLWINEKTDDAAKSEEDIFSSIKRYPAYNFKNTTVKSSKSDLRPDRSGRSDGKKSGPVSDQSVRPTFYVGGSESQQSRQEVSSESVYGRGERYLSQNFYGGNYQRGRNLSNESETSDVFPADAWIGRKESFVVVRPGGRSYFVPTGTDQNLFLESQKPSLGPLTRSEVRERFFQKDKDINRGEKPWVYPMARHRRAPYEVLADDGGLPIHRYR